jgi:hypothetical protein
MYDSSRIKFLSNVDARGPDDCWPWKGGHSGDGYGAFTDDYKVYKAHRISWALYNNKEVPEGKLILHKCNNKRCCNPNHLYCGTHGDNMTDMMRDNPQAHGGCYAKLHEGEIWLIRRLKIPTGKKANGNKQFKFSASYVGKMFNVSVQTILRIWNSEGWLSKEGTYV